LRASQADRERAIDVLKTAFIAERLTRDAFDLRVDQALASRTYGELAAATGGLRVGPAAGRPPVAGSAVVGSAATGPAVVGSAVVGSAVVGSAATGPAAAAPSSSAGRTLAKAARRSGVCILAAFVMVGIAALNHGENLALPLAFFSVVAAAIAVSGLLGYGVVDAWRVHRSRG
jgi:hypothetical protein